MEEAQTDNQTNHDEGRVARRRFPWGLLVVAAIFVLVPFLSWYLTWFGRPLSDSTVVEYLRDVEKPRRAQHALSQISGRIADGDESVRDLYSAVVGAASHPVAEVRLTTAWVMGQDNTSEEFHRALRGLLADPHVGVRQNAALALVRFNDDSGRMELVRMLERRPLRSEVAGTLELLVKEEGSAVASGAPVARVRLASGEAVEIRADQEARVQLLPVAPGAEVSVGDEVMVLGPSAEQAWEALRGLFIVGRSEDVPVIERYTRPAAGVPERVRQQAQLTIEAIRKRGG